MKREVLYLGASACSLLDSANDCPTDEPVGEARGEHNVNRDRRPNHKKQGQGDPVFPSELHDPAPSGTMSILIRPRMSSSHLLARSLMARCTSTSRIVSSTSSSGGTSAPR